LVHFENLKKFEYYTKQNPGEHGVYKSKVGYVIPEDFGFGFREANDTVWGLWKDDILAKKIWSYSLTLLKEHQFKIDILYDDEKLGGSIRSRYEKLIWWNDV